MTESFLGPADFGFSCRDLALCSMLFWNVEGGKGFSKTHTSAGYRDEEEHSERPEFRT